MKDEATEILEFRATILGPDNQPLANGEARLYTTLCSGAFWIPTKEVGPKLQESATTLKSSTGSRYVLKKFLRCPAHVNSDYSHFEFDYEQE